MLGGAALVGEALEALVGDAVLVDEAVALGLEQVDVGRAGGDLRVEVVDLLRERLLTLDRVVEQTVEAALLALLEAREQVVGEGVGARRRRRSRCAPRR